MNSTKISLISASIGSAVSATSAIYAFKQANEAKGKADQLKIDLQNAEANRQAVVNPFAGVTNPFANLGVATKAAEFQAEQADIALANTLDAVRQSGAGGATALAQAALKSKQGISADIQKQELDNSRLRAKGEMAVQKIVAEGEKFKWEAQEKREMQKLNRLQAQLDNQTAAQMAYRQAGVGALTDMAGNIMSVAGSMSDQENGNEGNFKRSDLKNEWEAIQAGESSNFGSNEFLTEREFKNYMYGLSAEESRGFKF